jgi:hypothetical protein
MGFGLVVVVDKGLRNIIDGFPVKIFQPAMFARL